jgi:hypothetical protein
LIARSGRFGTTNFGNPTEAARIRIEKMLEQSVTKVPILAVQTKEVYNISIPGALTFSQILRKQELSLAGG